MRFIGVALTVTLIAVSSARADGPIVVNADLGITMPIEPHPLLCYADHDSNKRAVINLDIGYRFIDQLAATVHFGGRRYPWEDCGGNIPGSYQMYRGLSTAFEVGAGVQWSMSRFWATTWIGIQDAETPYGTRHFAYALAAGVDVYVHPSGHRVGAYLDFTNAEGYDADQHVSAGIAYRFW
jgi:hypothetical protein